MKTKVALAILALVAVAALADNILFSSFIVQNASTSAPAQFSTTNLFVRTVTVRGCGQGGTARGTNTTTVWIGTTSGNDTQTYPIDPGREAVITAPLGHWLNLADWYFDVTTANDGVTLIFQ